MRASSWQGAHTWVKSSSYYCFCLLTPLSFSLRLQWRQRWSRNQKCFCVGVAAASDKISIKKGRHAYAIPISLLEFFIFVLKPILYFPIPNFSILFQPIFHNFTIFWVSEDHSQLFSILCLGESHRLASLASFKATVHCQ